MCSTNLDRLTDEKTWQLAVRRRLVLVVELDCRCEHVDIRLVGERRRKSAALRLLRCSNKVGEKTKR